LPQYKNFGKNGNFDKNENIGQHSICNFSIKKFGGREITQEGGEILQKFRRNFRHKFGKISSLQDFTKTATLLKTLTLSILTTN